MKKLFKSDHNFGFLIDTENYSGENEGDPLYLLNEDKNKNIEPDGKTITVDRNYLKRHPILTKNGKNALNSISNDPLTRNILVPLKFKKYERTIRKNFLNDFKFKRTLKDNYKRDKTPLKINVIYVKNSAQYPSYDKDIGGLNNKIKSPIAIVETGNTNIRNYLHYMTECYFFSSDSSHPYDRLKPLLKKYDLLSDMTSIELVYNTKVDDIHEIKQEVIKYVALALLTLVAFLTAMITAIHLYFVNWKYEIFIKYNLGYSLFKTHMLPFILWLLFNLFLLIIFLQEYVYKSLLVFITMIILEVMLITLELFNLNKKNKYDVLKGKE